MRRPDSGKTGRRTARSTDARTAARPRTPRVQRHLSVADARRRTASRSRSHGFAHAPVVGRANRRVSGQRTLGRERPAPSATRIVSAGSRSFQGASPTLSVCLWNAFSACSLSCRKVERISRMLQQSSDDVLDRSSAKSRRCVPKSIATADSVGLEYVAAFAAADFQSRRTRGGSHQRGATLRARVSTLRRGGKVTAALGGAAIETVGGSPGLERLTWIGCLHSRHATVSPRTAVLKQQILSATRVGTLGDERHTSASGLLCERGKRIT